MNNSKAHKCASISYHWTKDISVQNLIFYDNVVVYTRPIDIDIKYMLGDTECTYDKNVRYTFGNSINQ